MKYPKFTEFINAVEHNIRYRYERTSCFVDYPNIWCKYNALDKYLNDYYLLFRKNGFYVCIEEFLKKNKKSGYLYAFDLGYFKEIVSTFFISSDLFHLLLVYFPYEEGVVDITLKNLILFFIYTDYLLLLLDKNYSDSVFFKYNNPKDLTITKIAEKLAELAKRNYNYSKNGNNKSYSLKALFTYMINCRYRSWGELEATAQKGNSFNYSVEDWYTQFIDRPKYDINHNLEWYENNLWYKNDSMPLEDKKRTVIKKEETLKSLKSKEFKEIESKLKNEYKDSLNNRKVFFNNYNTILSPIQEDKKLNYKLNSLSVVENERYNFLWNSIFNDKGIEKINLYEFDALIKNEILKYKKKLGDSQEVDMVTIVSKIYNNVVAIFDENDRNNDRLIVFILHRICLIFRTFEYFYFKSYKYEIEVFKYLYDSYRNLICFYTNSILKLVIPKTRDFYNTLRIVNNHNIKLEKIKEKFAKDYYINFNILDTTLLCFFLHNYGKKVSFEDVCIAFPFFEPPLLANQLMELDKDKFDYRQMEKSDVVLIHKLGGTFENSIPLNEVSKSYTPQVDMYGELVNFNNQGRRGSKYNLISTIEKLLKTKVEKKRGNWEVLIGIADTSYEYIEDEIISDRYLEIDEVQEKLKSLGYDRTIIELQERTKLLNIRRNFSKEKLDSCIQLYLESGSMDIAVHKVFPYRSKDSVKFIWADYRRIIEEKVYYFIEGLRNKIIELEECVAILKSKQIGVNSSEYNLVKETNERLEQENKELRLKLEQQKEFFEKENLRLQNEIKKVEKEREDIYSKWNLLKQENIKLNNKSSDDKSFDLMSDVNYSLRKDDMFEGKDVATNSNSNKIVDISGLQEVEIRPENLDDILLNQFIMKVQNSE